MKIKIIYHKINPSVPIFGAIQLDAQHIFLGRRKLPLSGIVHYWLEKSKSGHYHGTMGAGIRKYEYSRPIREGDHTTSIVRWLRNCIE